jgi:hypothetical protein
VIPGSLSGSDFSVSTYVDAQLAIAVTFPFAAGLCGWYRRRQLGSGGAVRGRARMPQHALKKIPFYSMDFW